MSRSGRNGARGRGAGGTLAFVESPVQLLNVLEWAHSAGLFARAPGPGADEPAEGPPTWRSSGPGRSSTPASTTGRSTANPSRASRAGTQDSAAAGPGGGADARPGSDAGPPGRPGSDAGRDGGPGSAPGVAAGDGLTAVVLSPTDPMTRGQLRRVAELARDEGVAVRWEEARGGPAAPLKTAGSLARDLRRAGRVVIGDPFSRCVQLLLTLTSARSVVVVDDGTATMEFVAQLAGGEQLVRWHRKGSAPRGARAAVQEAVFAPFARRARSRLTPGTPPEPDGADAGGSEHGVEHGAVRGSEGGSVPGPVRRSRRVRRVEIFSSMPVDASSGRLRELGVTVTANDFSWTRARFGPPRLTGGTDLVGTSLVETGVVDLERYLAGVAALASSHGATRYFAHRRESAEKLHRVKSATGLEIVRPDLPLELVARRGPVGRTIVSFPSTVVHTLPLALTGTGVSVAVCEMDRTWFTAGASPRAEGFLSDVTDSARRARKLGGAPGAVPAPGAGGAGPALPEGAASVPQPGRTATPAKARRTKRLGIPISNRT